MKIILIGLFSIFFASTSFAAPRLLLGTERNIHIKALVDALRKSNDFDCIISEDDGVVKKSIERIDSLLSYIAEVSNTSEVYFNDQAGTQPMLILVGKTAGDDDHMSSFSTDANYQKIEKVEFKQTRHIDVNIGNLLNPKYQRVEKVVFLNQCVVRP